MEATEAQTGRRVALFVREELPHPANRRVGAIAEELSAMAAEGAVDEFDRTTWSKRVPLSDCDGRGRDVYLAFESWADDAGVRLDPFFQTRECYTPDAGDYETWLVRPAVCLAVYEDGEIAGVYPHTDGEETATVEDGIERLRADGSPRGERDGARVAVGD